MDFSDWYRDLESQSDGRVWCISLNCVPDFSTDVSDWVAFLQQVAAIRYRVLAGTGPQTTYAWHDEQACQLRFATANCEPDKLPFACKVDLQESPDAIVASWLNSPDCIPWDQLKDIDDNNCEDVLNIPALRVWVIQMKDA